MVKSTFYLGQEQICFYNFIHKVSHEFSSLITEDYPNLSTNSKFTCRQHNLIAIFHIFSQHLTAKWSSTSWSEVSSCERHCPVTWRQRAYQRYDLPVLVFTILTEEDVYHALPTLFLSACLTVSVCVSGRSGGDRVCRANHSPRAWGVHDARWLDQLHKCRYWMVRCPDTWTKL